MPTNPIFYRTLQQTPPTEWDFLRPAGHHWNHDLLQLNAEDESDSVPPSPNDGLEEYFSPTLACPMPQKPTKRNYRRGAKPARGHTPRQTKYHPPPSPSSGVHSLDYDYNTDWLRLSAAPFIPPSNHDQTLSGPELDTVSRDGSSSSKVDSKRIAHKLSEKTRRNRLTIAIREIQKLLPTDGKGGEASQTHSVCQEEGDFVVRTGVPSSKLDIVEMAVGFIKDLKEKNMEMAERVRQAERRLEECECQGVSRHRIVSSTDTPPHSDIAMD